MLEKKVFNGIVGAMHRIAKQEGCDRMSFLTIAGFISGTVQRETVVEIMNVVNQDLESKGMCVDDDSVYILDDVEINPMNGAESIKLKNMVLPADAIIGASVGVGRRE